MIVSEAHYAEPGFIGREASEDPPELVELEPDDLVGDTEKKGNTSSPLGEDPPVGSAVDPSYSRTEDATDQGSDTAGATTPEPSPLPGHGHVSPEEKEQLLDKLEKVSTGRIAAEQPAKGPSDQGHPPHSEPHSLMSTPQMARRGKGLAYFFRNYIQLGGRPILREGDELSIGGRLYELRPRKIDTRYLIIGSAVPALILLVIIASLVVGGGNTGSGDVVGIVLDEYGQPFLQGAEIHLVDRDLRATSNAQGFFEFDDLPAGPYEFRLMSGRAVLGRSHATIVGGQTSTLLLFPNLETGQTDVPPENQETPQTSAGSRSERRSQTPAAPSARDRSQSSRSRWASLRVESNVPNPRLTMDGETLGRGNSKYVKLLPGSHTYRVDAEGYVGVEGTIDLPPDQITTLGVSLEKNAPTNKLVSVPEDNYLLGTAASSDGDHGEAISRFTEVLKAQPNRAEAREARAHSYLALGNRQAAHQDLLRAGQIRTAEGHLNVAITNFNKAVEIDKNSLGAYLGRGEAYLAMNQPFAAVADFDAAVELDNNSFEAHYGLGRSRYQQRQFKRALKHFEQARKIDSQRPHLYRYMMLCQFANDEFDAVQNSYDRFVEVASPDERNEFHSDPQFSSVMRVIH